MTQPDTRLEDLLNQMIMDYLVSSHLDGKERAIKATSAQIKALMLSMQIEAIKDFVDYLNDIDPFTPLKGTAQEYVGEKLEMYVTKLREAARIKLGGV